MTLREEIMLHSGVLEEDSWVSENAMSALKTFTRSLERHEFLNNFENKAVEALENGQKDDINAFVMEAKQYMKFLANIASLVGQEQKAISESIDNVNKETKL